MSSAPMTTVPEELKPTGQVYNSPADWYVWLRRFEDADGNIPRDKFSSIARKISDRRAAISPPIDATRIARTPAPGPADAVPWDWEKLAQLVETWEGSKGALAASLRRAAQRARK